MERYEALGKELLGSEFDAMKDAIIEACQEALEAASVDDIRYDIIQEEMDKALSDNVDDFKNGVVPRLLVWNMLTLAHSDSDFTESENRLISHVVRVLQIDRSVYAEMKQLIMAGEAIQGQLDFLGNSERPYSEIRPLADEVENRRKTIIEAARALIQDDIVPETPAPEEKKGQMLIDSGKKLGEAITSGRKKLGGKAIPVMKDLGSKAGKGASDLKGEAGKLLGRMKGRGKKSKE